MYDRKLKYLRIIRILKDEIKNMWRLFGENAKYKDLLKILNDYPEYEQPTQKELLKTLQLNRQSLMTLLNELYLDFQYAIVDTNNYLISETEILFIVKIKDESREFIVKGLTALPRVGEEFNVYFINAFCEVAKVDHIIDGGVHQVFIYLKEKPFDYRNWWDTDP